MFSKHSAFGTLADRTGGRRALPCHVWVDSEPGVLVEWQRQSESWWGRVLHVVDGAGVESWVRAERIQPATTK